MRIRGDEVRHAAVGRLVVRRVGEQAAGEQLTVWPFKFIVQPGAQHPEVRGHDALRQPLFPARMVQAASESKRALQIADDAGRKVHSDFTDIGVELGRKL